MLLHILSISGNSGRPPASQSLSLSSPDFSDQSMNTQRDTAHVTVTADQPHSLNSENHDGWIILAFVDSKGFLKEKPWFRMLWSAITHLQGGFPQGRLAQSTAPFQAPSSPCGSFTYCSVAGAERHQESVQTATADSSLHCLWRKEEGVHSQHGPCCKCDSLCPEGRARLLSHLRCRVEKMCMI